MAVKDHSLDDKIVDAAKQEFMEHGFEKASLHKIAAIAGITTGALYTRYKGKDDLFCSLVRESLSEISINARPVRQKYLDAQENPDVEQILQTIKDEEKMYLDLLFDHYDQCILFFCKSRGSSVEKWLDQMMEEKSKETLKYFKSISRNQIDPDGVKMIMGEQFHYYRQILEKGYSREKAVSCMKTVELFLEAGWRALLEAII